MDDIAIVGGGIIGASAAYFLSKAGRKIKVFERDPTYKNASFPLSLGGFRRQFFQKENILLGKFAKEFIFQLPDLLETKQNGKPTVSVVPNGYLLLFDKEQADEQYEALKNHSSCDAETKNIKAEELQKVFPWISSEGLETATYTDSKVEGWVDPHMFHAALKNKEEVLVEGTQGTHLSLWHGTYPFVTSKDVTAAGICADVGLGPKSVNEVLVVFKAYLTRVGTGPMPGELGAEETEKKGWAEFGTVTGRPRRAAEFDFNLAQRAVMLNSATQIAITKLDVRFPECSGVKSMNELSSDAKSFIKNIEEKLEVPVTLIGTGPFVDDVIDLRT